MDVSKYLPLKTMEIDCVLRSDGDIVEQAEAASCIIFRVMTGWPDSSHATRNFPVDHFIDHLKKN